MSNDLVNALARRFIHRTDVKAWQHTDGAYYPDRTPITRADLNAHVAGTKTLGHYLLGTDNKCKFACFDIDLNVDGLWDGEPYKPREEFANPDSPYREGLIGQLASTAEVLARHAHKILGVDVAISFSGAKGCHVYLLTGLDIAADVRAAAVTVLEAVGLWHPTRGQNFYGSDNPESAYTIEVFPKQDTLDSKDLGNLLRLALGINRKSGKPGLFLRVGGGKRASFHAMDPIAALSGELPWKN